ncbi:MAG: hypothetical protein WCT99_01670 [Bacteroidota bacterium]|jgi:hypothetical protein
MKKYLSIMFIVIVAIPLFGQDDGSDDQTRDYSRPLRTKIGGAGGVTPIVAMFDNKEIDKFLTLANLPALGSEPIYLIGGEGYGYIMFLKNVRFGGFGAAGSKTVNAIENVSGGGKLKKEVEYKVSYGGFLIDYVVPVAYKLDVAVGASIGGGSVNIRMTRDNGSFKDWDSIWTEYGNTSLSSPNYTRNINGGFTVVNPHLNIEYTILPWFQLRVGVGYPIYFSPEWKLDEQFTIDNVSSKIKPQGYTINGGIMFGFFGW